MTPSPGWPLALGLAHCTCPLTLPGHGCRPPASSPSPNARCTCQCPALHGRIPDSSYCQLIPPAAICTPPTCSSNQNLRGFLDSCCRAHFESISRCHLSTSETLFQLPHLLSRCSSSSHCGSIYSLEGSIQDITANGRTVETVEGSGAGVGEGGGQAEPRGSPGGEATLCRAVMVDTCRYAFVQTADCTTERPEWKLDLGC